MKQIRKVMALVLAAIMVLAMSAVSFAADEGDGGSETPTATTKTITLENGKKGHTYTLYQIFTGKVDDKELTNIQWGSDANATFKDAYATAAAAAKAIATEDDARKSAQEWISKSYLGTGTASTALSADGEVKFENLAEGYYLIVDTSGPQEVTEGDFYSAVIVKVVKDVNMKLKGSAPTSEKKVDDKNDSDTSEDATTWQDSADYDIGDAVPFQLKATTADNVSAYKKYHITFQDKQSDGLDDPKSFTITVPGTEDTLTLAYNATSAVTKDVTFGTGDDAVTVTVTAEKATPATGNTFAIKISFETKPAGFYLPAGLNSQDILVNYTSVLNASAVIGSPGNPNESYITYSNKPESTDDSEEGKTPEDKVIVFTYKVDIDKIDETGAALKGADFTLYKQVAEGTTGATKGSELTFTEGVNHDEIKAGNYYVVVGNKTGSATGSTFDFKGIDDGIYVLVETTIPEGYNAYASKTVTVTATHDVKADDPKLLTLTATDPFTANKDAGNITKKDGTTHAAASGELYAEIENKSGAELPETGGIGTTLFYVFGTLLVVGGGVFLISRRRLQK